MDAPRTLGGAHPPPRAVVLRSGGLGDRSLGVGLVAVVLWRCGPRLGLLAGGKELADAVAGGRAGRRHLQGDHEEGRRLADAAVQRARALDGPFGIVTTLTFAVCSRALTGELADRLQLAEELPSPAVGPLRDPPTMGPSD